MNTPKKYPIRLPLRSGVGWGGEGQMEKGSVAPASRSFMLARVSYTFRRLLAGEWVSSRPSDPSLSLTDRDSKPVRGRDTPQRTREGAARALRLRPAPEAPAGSWARSGPPTCGGAAGPARRPPQPLPPPSCRAGAQRTGADALPPPLPRARTAPPLSFKFPRRRAASWRHGLFHCAQRGGREAGGASTDEAGGSRVRRTPRGESERAVAGSRRGAAVPARAETAIHRWKPPKCRRTFTAPVRRLTLRQGASCREHTAEKFFSPARLRPLKNPLTVFFFFLIKNTSNDKNWKSLHCSET